MHTLFFKTCFEYLYIIRQLLSSLSRPFHSLTPQFDKDIDLSSVRIYLLSNIVTRLVLRIGSTLTHNFCRFTGNIFLHALNITTADFSLIKSNNASCGTTVLYDQLFCLYKQFLTALFALGKHVIHWFYMCFPKFLSNTSCRPLRKCFRLRPPAGRQYVQQIINTFSAVVTYVK